LSRRALAEASRARSWWLANRDKAPDAFDEELDQLLELLEADAEHAGLPARGSRVRRILLERIRYYVYFRISGDGTVVELLAL
jgi:hypothetical protein